MRPAEGRRSESDEAASGERSLHIPKSAAVVTVIPKAALDDMNWLRGLAALAVLAGHIRGLFFVDYEAVHRPLAWLKLTYLVTAFGHQAVIVFFVLSGFFIGTSVASMSAAGSWSWRRFALRRFTRLYVVLIPALVLTTVWDLLGIRLFGTAGIYGGNIHALHLTLPNVSNTLSPAIFVGNLAFLQDVLVSAYGSNNPLWSLSYEFWAYLTFPLLYRAVAPGTRAAQRVAFLVIAAAVLVGFGTPMRFYFCIWSLGALLAVVWQRRPRRFEHGMLTAALGAVFVTALLVGRLRLLHSQPLEDVTLGVATVLFLMALLARAELAATRRRGRRWAAYARYGDHVAGFSYTLYVAHYPLLTFLAAWWMTGERWQATPANLFVGLLLGVGFVVLYALPLARLTEARTDTVRRWIERALGGADTALARRASTDGPRR